MSVTNKLLSVDVAAIEGSLPDGRQGIRSYLGRSLCHAMADF
jgi:hypothetical protein